jgi:hypothetical protein
MIAGSSNQALQSASAVLNDHPRHIDGASADRNGAVDDNVIDEIEDDAVTMDEDDFAEGAAGPSDSSVVWEGVPLEDLPRVGVSAPAQYPPLEVSRYPLLVVPVFQLLVQKSLDELCGSFSKVCKLIRICFQQNCQNMFNLAAIGLGNH